MLPGGTPLKLGVLLQAYEMFSHLAELTRQNRKRMPSADAGLHWQPGFFRSHLQNTGGLSPQTTRSPVLKSILLFWIGRECYMDCLIRSRLKSRSEEHTSEL